jgi:hypothetical protein
MAMTPRKLAMNRGAQRERAKSVTLCGHANYGWACQMEDEEAINRQVQAELARTRSDA